MKSRPDAPLALRGNQRGRDDRRAGMREHAEGVPLSARQHHFRVGKPAPPLVTLRAGHQDRGAVRTPASSSVTNVDRLLARRRTATRGAPTRGSAASGPWRDRRQRREDLRSAAARPTARTAAERLRAGRRSCAPLLQGGRRPPRLLPVTPASPIVASAESRRNWRRSRLGSRVAMTGGSVPCATLLRLGWVCTLRVSSRRRSSGGDIAHRRRAHSDPALRFPPQRAGALGTPGSTPWKNGLSTTLRRPAQLRELRGSHAPSPF